jgi:hypothetical protein
LTLGKKGFDLLERPEVFAAFAAAHFEGAREATLLDQPAKMIAMESDSKFAEIPPIENPGHVWGSAVDVFSRQHADSRRRR